MSKIMSIPVFLYLFILLIFPGGIASAAVGPVTITYPDITLPAGFASYEMPDYWVLNAGTVTICYTVDLSGAPNIAYTNNWNHMGIVGMFSGGSGVRMCGMLCDWANSGSMFPYYPDVPNNLDMDDKFNMQRFPNPGSYDEQMYNVNYMTAPPTFGLPGFNPWSNYGVWFDRDGVDPYQPNMWGMVNGGTYNTGGIYDVKLTFDKFSGTVGIVKTCMFPGLENDDDPTGYGIGTGFYISWKATGPDYYPTGISFDTDETKMNTMKVYVQGASGEGTIIVKDLSVTGWINHPPEILSVTADPSVLWPPNGKTKDVTVSVEATDPDGAEDIVQTTYSVADEYGEYDVPETVLPADGVISLIAARNEDDMDGRVYTITITVYDAGSLSDTETVTVVVPHDMGSN